MEGEGRSKKKSSSIVISRLRSRRSKPMIRKCNNCNSTYHINDVNNNLVVYLMCPYCLYKKTSNNR